MCDRLFQLGSAGIFAALLGVDYFTAFYHCWITATTGEHLTVIYLVLLHNYCLLITYLWCCPHTVGYGDVGIVTQGARGFAIFHMPVSVSWLIWLVAKFLDSQTKRKMQPEPL